jgi:cytochrome c oxidase subunit 3
MSLFARLTEKSWLPQPADAYGDPDDYRPSAQRVGLLLYFGVVTILFTIITAAYLMRLGIHGGSTEEHDWHSLPLPFLLWINTGVLFAASLAWEAARLAFRDDRPERLRDALAGAGIFGFLFLVGQLVVWRQLHEAGYYLAGPSLCLSKWSDLGAPTLHFVSSNPAVAFFYMITAIHGLHIAGGLAAWGRTFDRFRTGGDVAAMIDLSAIYWHFLLLVWLAMFGLLLST